MADQSPSEPIVEALVAGIRRGADLQAEGRNAEALAAWDEVLDRSSGVEGNEISMVVATVMYSKAHLLLSVGRSVDAVALAGQAAERAQGLPGESSRLLMARALGVQRAALTALGEHEHALAIDERLIEGLAGGESFTLRAEVGRATVHAIWTHGHRGEEAAAIAHARRLVDLVGDDEDRDHVLEVSELLLSGAEKLNHRRIWRRASPPVTEQIMRMCDAALALADRVDADLGEAVALSAQLARDDASLRSHQLIASYTSRRDRRRVNLTALGAVKQVEDTARQAGSENRYLALAMTRAATLADAGQTDQALRVLDELALQLNPRGRMLKALGPLAIRALRKTITSKA